MLPYATLEVAAAALGRNLTWFETIWFKYSATKSDFSLYCYMLGSIAFIFTLVPLPLVFIELSRSFEQSKIQPKVKYSFSDMLRCYGAVFKMAIVSGTIAQLVLYPSIQIIGFRSGLPLPSLMEFVAQFVVYHLVEDYCTYWTHRFLHTKWGYENIHHIHHEYTTPTAYSALYAHWGEGVVQGTPTLLGPALVPGHFVTFWCWLALREIHTIFIHSGYDFRWSLAKYIPFYGGSTFHDYHRYVGEQSHSNFGLIFTYCDYIYGTNKGYRIHMKHRQQTKESKKNLVTGKKIIN